MICNNYYRVQLLSTISCTQQHIQKYTSYVILLQSEHCLTKLKQNECYIIDNIANIDKRPLLFVIYLSYNLKNNNNK